MHDFIFLQQLLEDLKRRQAISVIAHKDVDGATFAISLKSVLQYVMVDPVEVIERYFHFKFK